MLNKNWLFHLQIFTAGAVWDLVQSQDVAIRRLGLMRVDRISVFCNQFRLKQS